MSLILQVDEGSDPHADGICHDGRTGVIGNGEVREKEALESMSPLTREIVKRFGFKEYCFSENEDAYKANFRMAYEREAKKREETAQLPEVLQARLNGILQIGEENGKDDVE
jgi:hypothetical protein